MNDTRQLSSTPEAPSPRRLDTTRGLPSRDLHTRDQSSSSSDSGFPPNRYADLKRNVVTVSAFAKVPTREEAPVIPNDGTLPGIDQVMPGQAVTGFGGIPVQGKLFPPMRAEPVADMMSSANEPPSRADTARPKRSFFSRGAASTKLSISKPIIHGDFSAQDSFGKITTVDLATAARSEKEKRDQAIERRGSVTLVATRPAPQPPAITPGEAMRRAQSLKRKEVVPTVAQSEDASRQTLSEPVALTSSAQLSPCVDELRRRSPRFGSQETSRMSLGPGELEDPRPAPLPDQKVDSPRRPAHPESPVISTHARPALHVTTIHSPQIFLSSQVPSPPKISTPEEGSPPLQVASLPQAPSSLQTRSSPQTVRQNPQFSKPPMPPMPPSPPAEHQQSLDPRMSILPRNNSVKTNIRPSRQRPPSVKGTPSPEGVTMQRGTAPGLPGNPRATVMQRIMYMNNIEYSDPASVKNILDGAAQRELTGSQPLPQEESRVSMVHRPRPIPRYNQVEVEANSTQEDTGSRNTMGRQRSLSSSSVSTKRSMLRAKAGSPSQLPPLPPIPKLPGTQVRPRPNNTRSMTFDEKMDIFYPVAPSGGNDRSHPAMPPFPPSLAETDVESRRDKSDRTTKTSFQTQSVVEIVGRRPPLNMRNTAKFSMDTETTTTASQAWLPPVRNSQVPGYSDPEDKGRRSSLILPYPADGMPTFVDAGTDDGSSMRGGSVHTGSVHAAQHAKPYVARMTNILRREDKETMTIMLDPSEAQRRSIAERESWMAEGELAMGESKVAGGINRDNNFHQRIGHDCPTFSNRREKVRSRKMPPPPPLLLRGASKKKNMVVIHASEPSPIESSDEEYKDIRADLVKLDRLGRESTGSEARKRDLLASLEREMGLQEDHWREMQDGLRDSLSTTQTSSRRASVYEAVARVAGQGRTQRGSLLKPDAVARVQLRSPTPPDTDESDDEGIAARIAPSEMKSSAQPPSVKSKLWQPDTIAPAPIVAANLLWTPLQKPLHQTGGNLSLTPVDTKPLPRKSHLAPDHPLPKLQSSSLWKKTRPSTAPTSHLWGTTAPIKKNTRPITQRPARKSRRMTLLPDILESPKPLPDKRETLGIFQFPWGERSDNASFDARLSVFRAMPGTMTTGGSASVHERAELEDYSESFFDEYDDLDDYDGFEDSLGEHDEEDDDFDETTLWEIASLLKVDKIPSETSLPSPEESRRSSVVDEYMRDEDDQMNSIIVALDTASLAAPPPPPMPSLWVKPARPRRAALGLPQPSVQDWMRYTAVDEAPALGTSRREEPGAVVSASLWKPTEPERKHSSLLWGPMTASPLVAPKQKASLWAQSANHKRAALGLPQPDVQTWMQYVVADMALAHRAPRREEPVPVTSTSLWKPAEPVRQHSSLMWTPGIAALLPKASLWAKSTNPGKAALGLPQPDTWARMQSVVVDRAPVRGAPRREEPFTIESASLWEPTKPVSGRPSRLWSPTVTTLTMPPVVWLLAHPAKPKMAALGLPQPDARAWARYIDNDGAPVRGARRRVEPASVGSSSLWGPAEPVMRHPSLLWGSVMQKGTTQVPHLSIVPGNGPVDIKVTPEHAGMSAEGPVAPLYRDHRTPVASSADWDAALREAVEASYPKRTKPAFAEDQEWAAALEEALALSKGSSYSLETASRLWSKPQSAKPSSGSLWQPGQTRLASDFVAPEKSAAQRRRAPRAEEPLPVFSWQRMWRIQDASATEMRNWLDDSVNKTFTGI